nr:S46 family peptidase [Pyrinomonadaceae bacterium]
REFIKFMLRKSADLPEGQKVEAIEKRFGSLKGEARTKAEDEFATKVVENPMFSTEKGLNDLLAMSSEQIRSSKDEFVSFVVEVAPKVSGAMMRQNQLGATVVPNRLTFMQGMAEMRGSKSYPDANFTQRFTYGYVQGYKSREAEMRFPFTTLDGLFEKETGRDPFKAPTKLRSLWESRNYGDFGVNGSMPLNFLTSHDIIGGNSGSPVLNANGEQVGIAFDGNYEGLGNDFFFNPAQGRTISVDIRYVLFITEKYGDAGWILKELNIKKGKAKAAGKGK